MLSGSGLTLQAVLIEQCQAFAANPDLKLPLQCVATSESISAIAVVLWCESKQHCIAASITSASKARICHFGCSEAEAMSRQKQSELPQGCVGSSASSSPCFLRYWQDVKAKAKVILETVLHDDSIVEAIWAEVVGCARELQALPHLLTASA